MSSSGQKSSVAQTCNLLSQYFKENGRFANRGVQTPRQQATTMNLLSNLENSAEISRQNVKANNDFFANIPSFASSNLKNDVILEHGTTSQMTIFYGGKVFVVSDFAAEKAKEIMTLLATTKSSSDVIIPDLNMAPTSGSNKSNNVEIPVQFKKASLQRFFEKRKDRAEAIAPYQVKSPSSMATAPPKRSDQSKYPVPELEGQSYQNILI